MASHAAAAEAPAPTDIHIVTLNCWGLKYISKQRPQRLAEIARRLALADPAPHIVALQECFVHDDYLAIRRATRHVLPHGKFYFAGPFGAGLALLSRWPIEEAATLPYPLNGRPTAFWRGDWYVGKGVACATLRCDDDEPGNAESRSNDEPDNAEPGNGDSNTRASPPRRIHVFNTHTHAPYNDTYTAHRLAQSWYLASLLRRAHAAAAASPAADLVLALGDFNMRPTSLQHRILTARAPVRDAWRLLHPDSALGHATDPLETPRRRPVPGALFNLDENGATSDSAYSTWRWPARDQRALARADRPRRRVAPDDPDPTGKRLDYIFLSSPPASASASASPSAPAWVVKSAAVGMRAPHPDLHCSLSDHFSVEATLTLHTPSSPSSSSSSLRSPLDAQLATAPAPPAAAQDALPLSQHEYDALLAEIAAYRRRERAQRTRRARTALALLALWLAALVAVWFAPDAAASRSRWPAFLLLLVGSLALAASVVEGLLALLFFPAELRALREFEWDVLNARAAALGGGEGPGALDEDDHLDLVDDKL
ncbi:hypothetical protein VDGE_03177 [Verticillium dahliae]|uniref:Endonuclease/exonuclease/phosphatase domain-containing protein n=1 Tax=Verticillium dahliae TaxID=27337 RepID=A0A444RWR7_VERDA|nr:hypothetical protein VDGE_03177 [Verticillium dahliae]